MALVNRCWFRSGTSALSDFTVASAINGYYTPAQCQNPSAVNGATYRYVATSDDETQHEEGEGVYTAATQILARTTVFSSSHAGGAKVPFSAAPKVMLTDLAQDFSSGVLANPFEYGDGEDALLFTAAATGPGVNDPVTIVISLDGDFRLTASDLPSATGGDIELTPGNGSIGGGLLFVTGDGSGGRGGTFSVSCGNGAAGNGGKMEFISGRSSGGNGTGGDILISGNDGNGTGRGSNVDIQAGIGGTNAAGGSVAISARGAGGGNNNGGDITLTPGAKSGTGRNGFIDIAGLAKVGSFTFANLPGAPSAGMFARVSDSSTATWAATIAGGGANSVLAWYNGTNWTVMGA